ncbi:hypothetical protein J2I47_26055 [Fibrella sp. HMF5335]|uniref:Outer membrane protein beta-barrel domain-containing protein n=1 Tax=Fibrella rubiginis TaxID=2817060 RepID=A0A939GKK6_9BACT|nr:hypothetical protein [Fibrella rubiginis]MBO0940036.1 hypothetical protein [Fibrella rubiginis]
MKVFFSFCLALTVTVAAQAQSIYKPFKVNVSIGAAIPSGGGGALFAIEPKYGINDQIDVGLRIEGAAMARNVVVNGNTSSGDAQFASSFILTGNYMFSDEGFRPFVGIGAGIYGVAGTGFTATSGTGGTATNGNIAAASVFGGMGRVGFKTGHFVLGVEYNLIPNSNSVVYDSQGTTKVGTSVQSKNSYAGIKVGFDIGGGRR